MYLKANFSVCCGEVHRLFFKLSSLTPLNTHFTLKNFPRPSMNPQTWRIGAFLSKNRHLGQFCMLLLQINDVYSKHQYIPTFNPQNNPIFVKNVIFGLFRSLSDGDWGLKSTFCYNLLLYMGFII